MYLSNPLLQVIDAWMRAAVIVFGAIGAVQIAAVGYIETALQRLPIEQALARLRDIIARKFASNFVEKVHLVKIRGDGNVAGYRAQATGVAKSRACG
jgi:hypothetical protein